MAACNDAPLVWLKLFLKMAKPNSHKKTGYKNKTGNGFKFGIGFVSGVRYKSGNIKLAGSSNARHRHGKP